MRAIVFAINGCPAGWLAAYGNDWVGTPNLDRFAAEGVVFDRHISDCPEPTAARRAWMGTRPEGGKSFPFPTILVRANHPDTDGPEWYYAGWQEVFDARPQPEDTSPLDELLRTFPALLDRLATTPDFLLWIETDRLIPPWDVQQDVFEAYLEDMEEDEKQIRSEEDEDEEEEETDEELEEDSAENEEEVEEDIEELDVSDSTSPVVPPPEEPVIPFVDPPTGLFDRSDLDAWDWLHRTFASVVTKLDAELGILFDHLRSRGLDQSATWIITSDFGYPLGEHGQVGLYRPWLHEELVHLPLLLRLPDGEQRGRRVAAFTQPPDLFLTLCALFGQMPPAETRGFNVLPLARGEAESSRECAITTLELGGAAEMAIRTDEWALLLPARTPEGDSAREPHLYAKPDDRWEVNDLYARNVERADELEAKLKEVLTPKAEEDRRQNAQEVQNKTEE